MQDNFQIDAVVKVGGHALDDPEARATFAKSLREAQLEHKRMALVHGGGPQINAMLKRLGIESSFINGLRVTTPETLEVAEMILCGQCNKEIVRTLESHSVLCAGICGEDGNTLKATPLNPELGRVGEITRVNPELTMTLINGGFLPVIAPIALDDHNQPININADTAAAWLAIALKARKLLLISDVPGVKDGKGIVKEFLSRNEIAEMKENGTINGGMIPKINACLHAIANGCSTSHILDGRGDFNLLKALSEECGYGTIIRV